MDSDDWLRNRTPKELMELNELLLFGGPHSVKSRQYGRHDQVWHEIMRRQKRQLDFMDRLDATDTKKGQG